MDKAGIFIAVAITAMAVAFTATGGLVSDTSPAEKITSPVMKLQKEAELVKKGMEDIQQAAIEARQTTQQAKEMAKEAVTAKLPARFVSIPQGTSVPGCEEVDLCYDPNPVTIFVGGEIIWRNDDSAAHTVTSGIVINGPDGNFDSGLLLSGETFSTMFNESGDYPYYCMIHPWTEGSVSVE